MVSISEITVRVFIKTPTSFLLPEQQLEQCIDGKKTTTDQFLSLPNPLPINVHRGHSGMKSNRLIEFGTTIDVSDLMHPNANVANPVLTVASTVVHSGTLESGHYCILSHVMCEFRILCLTSSLRPCFELM